MNFDMFDWAFIAVMFFFLVTTGVAAFCVYCDFLDPGRKK